MRHAKRLVPLLLLVAVTASCARATVASGEEGDRSSANRLVSQDILESGQLTLYEAVARLRPRWLRIRGNTTVQGAPSPIAVFQDNVLVGGIDILHGIRIENVKEVRWIRATDATTRWGMGYGSGAIEVISWRSQERR
jgi:hypothetical protein